MKQTLEITLDYPHMRLDRALVLAHPDISRMQWQKLIKEKRVKIGEKTVKASQKLVGGEVVTAYIPAVEATELKAEDLPIDIVFEDGELLVVNKAAGMVVHPAAGHNSGTLVNAILHHVPDLQGIGGELRPGIVHRLDKDTSGLMVVAKSEAALKALQAQFKARTVHKAYLALLEGHIQPTKALIDAPIGRDPRQRKKMAVISPTSSATSRPAQTDYELISTHGEHSLVRCVLHTGRTHQIRVHLAYAGFPLVGDAVYGRRKQLVLKHRHFLHSAELSFQHPKTGMMVEIKSELPEELAKLLTRRAPNEPIL